jgi:uncharacterized protein (TIRG00374 family)
MSGRLRLLLGLAVSALCFYLVVRVVDWPLLAETYRGVNCLYLLPALALVVLTSWARAYRWRLLMFPNDQQPLGRLFSIVNIGYLFNNILPAKAGEVVRGYLVGRMLPGGLAQGLPTLLVERLLDALTLVLLSMALIPFVALPRWAITAGLFLGLVAVAGAVLLAVLARYGERGLDWAWCLLVRRQRLLGRLPRLNSPRVRAALENLLLGLRVLAVGRLMPGIVFWSLLIWLGYVLGNYVVMAAFGMTHLPVTAAAAVLCATGYSMLLPSSPGAFGPLEGAAVLALGLYGVGESQAFGYAFGQHVFTAMVLVLLGLWGLRRESLTFGGIRTQALAAGSPPETARDSDGR